MVSCQPLDGLFEEVERRGLDPRELIGDTPRTLGFLRDRRNRVHWDEFRAIIDHLVDRYDDDEIVEIGRQLVHTVAQRPFGLIAKHFFSIDAFYRAVFSPNSGWGRPMFPCFDSTFVRLDDDVFEATLTIQDGFAPSHAFGLITKGNIIGMPEVLGCLPAEVRMDTSGRTVRFEIRASDRSTRLGRLRRRLSLPFRSGEVAAELREAHASLSSRYDALQDALNEREATTAALLESKTRLRLTLESVEMAVWDWDMRNDAVILDDVGRKMFGYSDSEVTPARESFIERVHEEDRSLVLDEVRACLATGNTYAQEFRVAHSGEVRTLVSRGHIVRDELGEPIRFIGVSHDVTDELHRTQGYAHLGQVVANSPLEIYVADQETGRFLDVNTIARENLGYTMDELRELIPADINGFDDEAEFNDVLESVVRGETASVLTNVQHIRKDGSSYPLELSMQTSVIDSRPVIVAIGVDVSDRVRAEHERRTLESQLWRAQKLDALGTLASGIAHDFNNLLMAISGYAELASTKLPADSSGVGYLDRVLQATDQGRALARQVLTFSRANEQPQTPTELGPVVAGAIDLLAVTLPASTRVEAELAPTGCVVHADASQIGQVVTNLCTNAAHASAQTSTAIEVRLEACELDDVAAKQFAGLRPGPHACLTVADRGLGIQPDVMERIFDPFFTTKDAEGGTGLGLAVVHGIVQAHRGAIDVRSEPGEGTTVRVLLPCHDHVDDVAALRVAVAARRTGRVLLVDDEEHVADMLALGLQRFGYRVRSFTSSRTALEAFAREPNTFDVVITDQTMPDTTGLELAEKLHEIRPDLPIVLISGRGVPTDAATLQRVGLSEVLSKPFSLDELDRVVARVLADAAGATAAD